jgi:uncharacterized protein YraI
MLSNLHRSIGEEEMRRSVLLVSLLMMISISTGIAAGQGVSTLTPGGGLMGSLNDQTPLSIYTFSGTEGDLATVRVLGLTPGMTMSLSLLSTSQESLGSSDSDPFTRKPGAASVSSRLPGTGTYTALVGGTPGDYVITLDLFTPPPVLPLGTNAPATASLSTQSPLHVYSFNGNSTGEMAVTVDSGEGSIDYSASFYNPDGSLITVISGLANACLGIPAGDGIYLLVIELQDDESTFSVSVTLQNGACASANGPAQPIATQELSGPPPSVCTAIAGSAANIRSGPGTEFDIIGTLNAGQGIPIVGTSGTGWYFVQSAAIPQGWISASVVTAAGPCGSLPTVESGQVPPPVTTQEVGETPGTPTYTYTASPTLEPGQPTYTYTHTYTATQTVQATATYTATQLLPSPTNTVPVPTAPPDANYVLNVPLDGTVSVTDFVSYPNGDTEDRVSYSVTGLNPNSALPGGRAQLVISVSCFGTGTNQLLIRADGQNYSCGQTVIDREVNFDSNTGAVIITATGGTNTYVQWVLTGTATRLN